MGAKSSILQKGFCEPEIEKLSYQPSNLTNAIAVETRSLIVIHFHLKIPGQVCLEIWKIK